MQIHLSHPYSQRDQCQIQLWAVVLVSVLGMFMLLGHNATWAETFSNPKTRLPHYVVPVVTPSPFSHSQPRIKLPEEPDEFDPREVEAFYDWRNDMFFRRFDMTGKGTVDYMTARRTYKVWLDDYGTPSVITVADPLFYWMDLNGNGKFEQELGEMWLDSFEDGPTGNEKPYDNSDLQQAPTNIPSWSAPNP